MRIWRTAVRHIDLQWELFWRLVQYSQRVVLFVDSELYWLEAEPGDNTSCCVPEQWIYSCDPDNCGSRAAARRILRWTSGRIVGLQVAIDCGKPAHRYNSQRLLHDSDVNFLLCVLYSNQFNLRGVNGIKIAFAVNWGGGGVNDHPKACWVPRHPATKFQRLSLCFLGQRSQRNYDWHRPTSTDTGNEHGGRQTVEFCASFDVRWCRS